MFPARFQHRAAPAVAIYSQVEEKTEEPTFDNPPSFCYPIGEKRHGLAGTG